MASSTQTQHPWRATLRTTLQTALAVAAALVAALPLVSEFAEQFWPGSPVVAWIAGTVAIVAAAAGLITRIMALDAVDNLLQRVGLSAAPKDVRGAVGVPDVTPLD